MLILALSYPSNASSDNQEDTSSFINTLRQGSVIAPSKSQPNNILQPLTDHKIINIKHTPPKVFSYHFKESSLDEKKIQVNVNFKF